MVDNKPKKLPLRCPARGQRRSVLSFKCRSGYMFLWCHLLIQGHESNYWISNLQKYITGLVNSLGLVAGDHLPPKFQVQPSPVT